MKHIHHIPHDDISSMMMYMTRIYLMKYLEYDLGDGVHSQTVFGSLRDEMPRDSYHERNENPSTIRLKDGTLMNKLNLH